MNVAAQSLALQVYDALRQRITEQAVTGGDPLAVAALAQEFGVSATPIREALARLHADGLVVLVQNRGYRVAPAPDAAATMHWMDARVIIEVNTLRLAAGALTPDLLMRLQGLNDQIVHGHFGGAFSSLRAFAELNAAFHATLVEAAGNQFLLRAWREVALTAQFSRIHYRSGVRHKALIGVEHQRVIDALRARDIDGAAEALRRHIVDSLDRDQRAHTPEIGVNGRRAAVAQQAAP